MLTSSTQKKNLKKKLYFIINEFNMNLNLNFGGKFFIFYTYWELKAILSSSYAVFFNNPEIKM